MLETKKQYFGAFIIRDFFKQDGMNRTQVQGEKHLWLQFLSDDKIPHHPINLQRRRQSKS